MKRARGKYLETLKRSSPKGKRRRWTNSRRRQLFEEDTQHGDLEKYNKRGMHEGTVDPQTGEIVKPPVRGRRIEI